MFSSLKSRLTVITTAALISSSAVTFVLLYVWLETSLASRLDAALASEWNEFIEIYRDGGEDALQKELVFEQEAVGPDGGFMVVYSEDTAAYDSGDLSTWGSAATPAFEASALNLDAPIFDDARGTGNGVPLRRLHGLIEPGTAVLMAYSKQPNLDLLSGFLRGSLLAFAAILIPVLLSAWFIARHAMRGVDAVTSTATNIVAGDTNQRVDVHGQGREIVLLGEAFNGMLDHLLKVVKESRELNDNIAHDLRTPLTRLRSIAERLAQDNDSPPHVQEAANELVAESDALISIANTMLDISEMEAGVKRLAVESIDVGDLVSEVGELYGPAAEDTGVEVSVWHSGHIQVSGDRQLLRRAICNVLDNAIKYSPNGGRVEVSAESNGECAEIVVKDSGIGISEADLPKVFERFFRSDRARQLRGNGLGLGLAKAIAVAHGGDVQVSSKLGAGTTVKILLASGTNGPSQRIPNTQSGLNLACGTPSVTQK